MSTSAEHASTGDFGTGASASGGERRSNLLALFEFERERFFLWSPVCLGLGIAGYFALPAEPPLSIAVAPLVLVMIVCAATTRGTLLSAALVASLLASAGFAIAKLRVEIVRAPVLAKKIRNADLRGVVAHVESRYPRGQRVTIEHLHISGVSPEDTPSRVRIRTLSDRSPAAPGDRIRLRATLSPPARPALPGGFDYARTAWFDQIGGVGFAFAAPAIESPNEPGTWIERYRRGIERLRQTIAKRVRAALPGETGEIALALMTRERGGIPPETTQAFKNSGLSHILAISGLHMVMMAGTVFYVVRLLLAAVPRLALSLPVKKLAAVAGMMSALAYLAISGGAFSTIRATLMISIMFGAVLLDRPALSLRNVAIAALIILSAFPESLFDAGFQMSFAAVTALIAAHEIVRRIIGRSAPPGPLMRLVRFFGAIIASTLIASTAVAPFAAYNFHQSQQYAILANIIAIPICNFIVMPAALGAMVLMPMGLEGIALRPMGWGIDAMIWCANRVASLPGAVGHLPEIPMLAFLLIVAGGLWLSLWQTRLRIMGTALILLGLIAAPWTQRPDVLIAQRGGLVAVREASGRLSSLSAKSASYDLERWLEYDGDGRSAAEAQLGAAFTCDAVGCIAHVKGATVAVARHPAAVGDDCANADVLVIDLPKPADCPVPAAIIDVFDRWRNGAYALFIDRNEMSPEPRIRFETVAARRGERPWSPLPQPAPGSRVATTPAVPGTSLQSRSPVAPAGPAPENGLEEGRRRLGTAVETEPQSDAPFAYDDDPGEDARSDPYAIGGETNDNQ